MVAVDKRFKSEFRLFSLGYVSQDKAPGSDYIRAIPVETVPELDGVIKDENVSVSFSGVDSNGDPMDGSLTTSIAIPCKWIGSEGHRATAPDVRVGEPVWIYQYANKDEYFWQARNTKSNLRDQESMIFLVAAKPKGDQSYLDVTNSYSMMVSSMEQVFNIRTTMANGEVASYMIQFDGKNGQCTLLDNFGNGLQLESPTSQVTLRNKQGSVVILDKENIKVKALGNLNVDIGKDITIDCKNMTVNAEKVNINLTDYTLKGTNVIVSASNVTWDVPQVNFNSAQVTISGALMAGPTTVASLNCGGVSATMKAKYKKLGIALPRSGISCSIKGNMQIEGNMAFKGGNMVFDGGSITGVGVLECQTITAATYNGLPPR